jgi:hypothetical protein
VADRAAPANPHESTVVAYVADEAALEGEHLAAAKARLLRRSR